MERDSHLSHNNIDQRNALAVKTVIAFLLSLLLALTPGLAFATQPQGAASSQTTSEEALGDSSFRAGGDTTANESNEDSRELQSDDKQNSIAPAAVSEEEVDQAFSVQAVSDVRLVLNDHGRIECGKEAKVTCSNDQVKFRVERIAVEVKINGESKFIDDYVNPSTAYGKEFNYIFLASSSRENNGYRITYSVVDNNGKKVVSSQAQYFAVRGAGSQVWKDYPTLDTKAQEIAKSLKYATGSNQQETDYNKAVAVHDYLISLNAKLNEKSANVGPTGVLLRGEGTSESYHQAAALLLSALNVETERAAANGKVWTLVKIGNKWTHVDVASDQACSKTNSAWKYVYFGATDTQMKRLRPAYSPKKGYEVISNNLNYYVKKDQFGTWLTTMKSAIEKQLKANKVSFTVNSSWTDPGVNAIVMDNLAPILSGRNLFTGFTNGKRPVVSFVYTGTTTKGSGYFRVSARNLSSSYLSVSSIAARTYIGSAIKPTPTLTLNGVKLKQGTDYKVTYSNNVNAGTATITFTGIGNYAGSAKRTFKINKASVKSAAINGVTDKIYTGKKITQKLTVKLGGRALAAKDYSVAYANNTKVGTATVTITGKGNYTGTAKKTFKIKLSMSKTKVLSSNMTRTATGKALTPSVTVKYGSKALRKGTDYYLTYNGSTKAPTKAGTYTVRAVGKGYYSGTKTVGTFRIVKAGASTSSNTFSSTKTYEIYSVYNSNYVLDAAGAKPSIGANVSLWTRNGGKNQKWYLIPDGKGNYYIKSSANKNFLLDAAGKRTTKGANISIWTNNGGANQKWKIQKQKDGTYIIRSVSNNKLVLDAAGASPRIGANVTAWTNNGGKNQRWRIRVAS